MVSGRRIDFYDDPAAPTATCLVPPVNVVVANEAGEILLIRRTDNENWAVPGGAIEFRNLRALETPDDRGVERAGELGA